MSYLGTWQIGDVLPLIVQTTDANGLPATPDHCPNARIFDPTGQLLVSFPVPVLDRYGQAPSTGLFLYPMPVTSVPIIPVPGTTATTATFANLLGNYTVEYSWSVGSFTGHSYDTFQVVPAGDTRGTVTSMTHYARPFGSFLVCALDSGTLRAGRNPRLA